MAWLANAIKSLAFQPRTRKKGNKSRRGRWKTLLGAGTPGTPVFTKRRVLLSFSHSLSLSFTLLVHCHTGASRHNAPARRCGSMRVQADNLYGVWICQPRNIIARANTHDSCRVAINIHIYRKERPVFTFDFFAMISPRANLNPRRPVLTGSKLEPTVIGI